MRANPFLTVALAPFLALAAEPSARLELDPVDAAGRPIAARIYLRDDKGAPVTPPGVIAYHRAPEHHFVVAGSSSFDLPAGRYTITAERGTEHRPATATIDLTAGGSRQLRLRLERWIDMNARGWYSGDLHNHRKPEEMPALLAAEDLNLAPTLSDWVWADGQRKPVPPPAGDAIVRLPGDKAYSLLDKEIERLENGPGAVDLLGLKSPVPFDGYRLAPPNAVFCEAAHGQGGFVDAEKIVWRDGAALAALGHLDFAGIVHNHFNRHGVLLETDRWGMIPKERAEFNTVAGMPLWSMEAYYHIVNCGIRLAVSGGSATGVMASPLGYCRTYVKLDEPFSYEAWLRGLKAGRSFATNGPIVFLTVAGADPGATVRVAPRGGRLRVRAEAQTLGDLDRLEIVWRGKVVRSTAGADGRAVMDFELPVAEAGWIAARAFERPTATIRFAHTSPVFVEGPPAASAAEDARWLIAWIDREIRHYETLTGFRSEADRAAMLDFFRKARAVYERVK